jgi:hypothetical protein
MSSNPLADPKFTRLLLLTGVCTSLRRLFSPCCLQDCLLTGLTVAILSDSVACKVKSWLLQIMVAGTGIEPVLQG